MLRVFFTKRWHRSLWGMRPLELGLAGARFTLFFKPKTQLGHYSAECDNVGEQSSSYTYKYEQSHKNFQSQVTGNLNNKGQGIRALF